MRQTFFYAQAIKQTFLVLSVYRSLVDFFVGKKLWTGRGKIAVEKPVNKSLQ